MRKIISEIKYLFFPCSGNQYYPKFLRKNFLVWYIIFILILKILTLPFIIYFPKNLFFAEIVKTVLFDLVNKERKGLGMEPLKENPQLDQAAYLKAKDILEKDYFSHWSPEGISPWYWFKISNYQYKAAGENLAIGFLDSEEVYQAWLNSPSHRANLLNPAYKEMGIAILKGDFQGNETTVVVQLFGTPLAEEKPKVITEPEKPKEKPEEIVEEKPKERQETSKEKKVLEAKEKIPSEVITFNLLHFFSSKYHHLIQKVIYASLILLIFSFLIAIFFDIFIYKKFEIQYKELIFNFLFFSILLIIFLYIDKIKIIQLIPHNFKIY